MTDEELIGQIVKTPNARARILVCSQLLDLALVEIVDDHDQPTGRRGTLCPSNFETVQ